MGSRAPVALGYSNGANIAAAVLLLHPKTLEGAILLRATTPLAEPPRPDLSGVPVLILSGLNDPVIPRSGAEKLASALAAAGARVERVELPAGHGLTQADVDAAKAFYRPGSGARPPRAALRGRAPEGRASARYSVLATNLTISVMTVEAA